MPFRRMTHAWRWPVAWLTLCTLVALGVGAVTHEIAQRQIEREASTSVMHYAATLTTMVPDLPTLLRERRVSAAAVHQLRRFQSSGELFEFRLYDRDGQVVLEARDLLREDLTTEGSLAPQDGAGPQTVAVAAMARHGQAQVALVDGRSAPDRPPRYSQAFAPVTRDGEIVGVVEVLVDQTAREARLREGMVVIVTAVAGGLGLLAVLAIVQTVLRSRQQRRVEERVRYLAQHDALSGALNRTSFGEVLAQAAKRQQAGSASFAVLCLDLDRFKDVNDVHGHAAGDEVLRQASARLQALLRQRDQLARLGGDEFAVLQLGLSGPAEVRALAQRIVDALAAPYDVDGRRIQGGTSVGAAVFGRDADTVDDLMHKADLALYRAKAQGRGAFSFYDAELDRQLQAQRALTAELREAISAQTLQVHYQPLFAGDGRTLTGYEALLRWPHPARGNVPPSVFIPLAEESGLIEPLGRWVLHRACEQAATWPAGLTVAVNLSPVQFRSGTLVAAVEEALRASRLAPWRLELEITESLLMSDTEPVLQTLQALRSLGARIAMDDFGTGYSSLAYLWRFPFDKLKIDQAFTRALGDDAKVGVIVHSIVSLAHALQIRVNAEGVETEQQFRLLQQHGCDEVQGFLFGRAQAPELLLHAHVAQGEPPPARPADTAMLDLPTLPMPL